MSRLSDLVGVLRGAKKVTQALNTQCERTAGDAWNQSSIREGVEHALKNRPTPQQIGKDFVDNIPKPIMELRGKLEEIKDSSSPEKLIKHTLSDAVRDTQKILSTFSSQNVSDAMKGITEDDVVDDSTISNLNVGTAQSKIPTEFSLEKEIQSIISAVTNYKDILSTFDTGAQQIDTTIDSVLRQLDDISSGKVFSDMNLDIPKEELDGFAATGAPLGSYLKSRDMTSDSEFMLKLRSDLAKLEGEANRMQSEASKLMSHVAEGDIDQATALLLQNLSKFDLDELESSISNLSFGAQYPGFNGSEKIDSSSSSSSSSSSEDDRQSNAPVTLGNYQDPFPPKPPSREYSTLTHSHSPRLLNYRSRPIYNNNNSIYRTFLRRMATSAKAKDNNNNNNNNNILAVSVESIADETIKETNKSSLSSYKVSGGKRRSLDSRAKRRAVPDTKIKRALGFGALAASVGWGTISEMAKRSVSDPTTELGSVLLSDDNVERIVTKLCEMRGAALKIGQMISIQDEGLISPEFAKIMARVRENADFMPEEQLESQMSGNLGSQWKEKFKDFEVVPFAAASLGQVHYATLHDDTRVVVKVQYPGVADSINSDIDNLTALLGVVNLVPKGAHVDKALAIAKKELAYETDYLREAKSQEKMRRLLASDPDFEVPRTFPELTTKHVLTQQFVEGDPIDNFVDAPLEVRNSIGLKMLKLCLRELFEFQYMQTDPNWSNFFYDTETNKIKLLDFGATLELSEDFSNNYLQVIRACATDDRQVIIDASIKMEFLSGYESEMMLDAHCEAIKVVGEPFASDGPYNFVEKEAYKRIGKLLEVFAKHRITPPPEESYALNRKLSGAFLLCNKLNAVIPCKPLFDRVYNSKVGL